MSGDLAAKLLAGSRFAIMAALRQTLGAAVDWGYIDENPAKKAGKNPQPPPRPVRPYTFAELDTIALELSAEYEPLPDFAAGDRASSRRNREVVEPAGRCRSPGAALPRSTGSPPASIRRCYSRRAASSTSTTSDAASGTRRSRPRTSLKPARIYDLRSTFASNALAAGVPVFELAKIMGSSVRMIERHYGALLDGAGAGINGRLDALEAQLRQDAEADES